MLPPLILLLALLLWRLRPVAEMSSLDLLPQRRPSPLHRSQLPFWLTAVAAMLAGHAATSPSATLTLPQREHEAINVAFALDLSGSMDASDWPHPTPPPPNLSPADLPPSRLQTAKRHLAQLLNDVPGLRTALIAFADNAILVAPLADRPDTLQQRLQQLRTDQLQDGTRIGVALIAHDRALQHAPNGPRVIVLLSDGVDHTDASATAPLDAARTAANHGVTIHAVAIGGPLALHPVTAPDGTLRHEARGEPLDADQLAAIATAAGGQLHLAQDTDALAHALSAIAADLRDHASLRPVQRTVSLTGPLLLAAALAAAGALWLSRPPSRHHQATSPHP